MRTIATTLAITFLFTALFLSFTLAACGTADTPICASLFGMGGGACDANTLEHHTSIVEQVTRCTLDASLSVMVLAALSFLAFIRVAPLSFTQENATHINSTFIPFSRIMNPFDAFRFALLAGRTSQRKESARAV